MTPKKFKYDKRHYCLYCTLPQSKIQRHLISAHKDEDDVALLSQSTGKERQQLMTKIRNLGSHRHNINVKKSGQGNLSVVYRPVAGSTQEYVPCTDCFGWFAQDELWKHSKRCILNDFKDKKNRQHVKLGKALIPTPAGTSEKLKQVFTTMRMDPIGLAARNDRLVCEYGERLHLKHGHDPNKHTYIRSQLRDLGRILIKCRETTPTIQKLEHCIHPQYFSTILKVCRDLAGFDNESHTFEKPSLAMKLGTLVMHVTDVLLTLAIERNDVELKERCGSLKSLFEIRWTTEFTSNAHRTAVINKKNTINIVPLTDDVKRLTVYLQEQTQSNLKCLMENPLNRASYIELQKSLLVQIILFNRRRPGEVSKMNIDDLAKNKTGTQTLTEEDLALTNLEKRFTAQMSRVEITGKRERTVAVLLSHQMKSGLEEIMKHRPFMGINVKNKHVFCITTNDSLSYIRGGEVLKEYGNSAGLKRPDAIRATKLRKHVATMSQLMSFKENELDILADFMGHDIKVHREFYRLSDEVVQLAKVSKFLVALEKGQLPKYQGKTLDDIEIPDDNLDCKLLLK